MVNLEYHDHVRGWLKNLGITQLCQWDVLVFLHRHRSALVSAEFVSCLIGYSPALVVSALDELETLGLVERSRLSQGVRLYRLTRMPRSPGHAFTELLALGDSRVGRLAVVNELGKLKAGAALKVGSRGGSRVPRRVAHPGTGQRAS